MKIYLKRDLQHRHDVTGVLTNLHEGINDDVPDEVANHPLVKAYTVAGGGELDAAIEKYEGAVAKQEEASMAVTEAHNELRQFVAAAAAKGPEMTTSGAVAAASAAVAASPNEPGLAARPPSEQAQVDAQQQHPQAGVHPQQPPHRPGQPLGQPPGRRGT